MKVLVTGGSGFIGSHLVKKLIDKKYEVRVLDLSTPRNSKVEFLKGNVTNLGDVRKAVKDCEYVFHMASLMSVENTEKNPIETLNTNIDGTRNVLECCLNENVKKILFTSSSEVYGESRKFPTPETGSYQPKSCYGISKVTSEEYVKSYGRLYGLNFIILRYFNVYGPGQSTNFVIPKFVDLALRGEPIAIHGSGDQTRAFCFIDDIINGTFIAFFKKEVKNEIFNIGNGNEPIKIKLLAKNIIKLAKSNSYLKYLPFSQTDRSAKREIFKRIPDISKARKMLGYEPEVELKSGIMKVIEHMKVRK